MELLYPPENVDPAVIFLTMRLIMTFEQEIRKFANLANLTAFDFKNAHICDLSTSSDSFSGKTHPNMLPKHQPRKA